MIREVGTLVQLRNIAKDVDGTPTNVPTLILSVTDPAGTVTTPAVTNTGAGGLYTASLTVTSGGTWLYRWTASGAVIDVVSDQLSVTTSQRALVASMEELRAHLRRTDSADDAALRSFLIAATDWVEWAIGGPLSVQTFAEQVVVKNMLITPLRRPLVSVTSLVPDLAAAIDPSNYVADTDHNVVRVRFGGVTGWHTLTYAAGLAYIPERVKLAGLMITDHLWQVENSRGARGQSSDESLYYGMGWAVPRRAAQLLAPRMVGGIA